jgi:hypothetical protein
MWHNAGRRVVWVESLPSCQDKAADKHAPGEGFAAPVLKLFTFRFYVAFRPPQALHKEQVRHENYMSECLQSFHDESSLDFFMAFSLLMVLRSC